MPFDGVNVFSPTFDTLGTFTRSVADARDRRACAGAVDRARRGRGARIRRDSPCLAALPGGTRRSPTRARSTPRPRRLRRAGAEVVPVALPDAFEAACDVLRTIMLAEAAQILGPLQERERARLSRDVECRVSTQGRAIGADTLARDYASRRAMIAAATAWLADFDALVAPPAPGPAPEGLATTGDPSCCTFAVAARVPGDHDSDRAAAGGLPLGMQLVARADDDDALLSVAAWCEAALPRWQGLGPWPPRRRRPAHVAVAPAFGHHRRP